MTTTTTLPEATDWRDYHELHWPWARHLGVGDLLTFAQANRLQSHRLADFGLALLTAFPLNADGSYNTDSAVIVIPSGTATQDDLIAVADAFRRLAFYHFPA